MRIPRGSSTRVSALVGFIGPHKGQFGIAGLPGLGIPASTYYAANKKAGVAAIVPHAAARVAERQIMRGGGRPREGRLYGARKAWRQLRREGIPAGPVCAVERLMRELGHRGSQLSVIYRFLNTYSIFADHLADRRGIGPYRPLFAAALWESS